MNKKESNNVGQKRKTTSMLGNTYKILGWEVYASYPKIDGVDFASLDVDTRTEEPAIYIHTIKDEWYMAKRVRSYKWWVLYTLKFIRHNVLKDIRKSYLYGNKYKAKKAT